MKTPLHLIALAACCLTATAAAQDPTSPVSDALRSIARRSGTNLIAAAEEMPADKYGFKPAGAEISSFGDQLMHVTAIVQRFVDAAKGTKTEAAHHGAMTKPEIMALMKKTFQSAEEAMATLSDAQMLEPVKFPFGDRTVTRATFWQGPLYQLRNHYGQLVVYLRMNGIVPPASRR